MASIVGGKGIASTGQGVPQTYSLNAGDVLRIEQDAELNGSPIQSNFPVGVRGGHS
jgi:IgGFc binding protein